MNQLNAILGNAPEKVDDFTIAMEMAAKKEEIITQAFGLVRSAVDSLASKYGAAKRRRATASIHKSSCLRISTRL
jgi:hypothetical protein